MLHTFSQHHTVFAPADTHSNAIARLDQLIVFAAPNKAIPYCFAVFFNNTAEYEGDDIYSYDGDVDYSSNWWGDNQKPGSDRIFKFLGTLTLNDWVIMTLEYVSSSEIRAGLNHIRANSSTYLLNHNMPERLVRFSVEGGSISPEIALLINGSAYANLDYTGVKQVNALIMALIRKRKTIIILTHELEKCLSLSEHFIVLFEGEKVFDGKSKDALNENLEAWGIRNPLKQSASFEDLL